MLESIEKNKQKTVILNGNNIHNITVFPVILIKY